MDIDMRDYVIAELVIEHDKFGKRVKDKGTVLAVGENVPADVVRVGDHLYFEGAPDNLERVMFTNRHAQQLCGIRYSDAVDFFQDATEGNDEYRRFDLWANLEREFENRFERTL